MKKQKKLSLKKVNIATINHIQKIRGGATDTFICDPKSIAPTNCLNVTFMRGCVVSDPFGACAESEPTDSSFICDETTNGRGNTSI